jgi:hypothetical protein
VVWVSCIRQIPNAVGSAFGRRDGVRRKDVEGRNILPEDETKEK